MHDCLRSAEAWPYNDNSPIFRIVLLFAEVVLMSLSFRYAGFTNSFSGSTAGTGDLIRRGHVRIYSTSAEQLRGQYPATAAIFDEMAGEEDGHRQLLTDMFRRRFGKVIPMIRREDVARYGSRLVPRQFSRALKGTPRAT